MWISEPTYGLCVCGVPEQGAGSPDDSTFLELEKMTLNSPGRAVVLAAVLTTFSLTSLAAPNAATPLAASDKAATAQATTPSAAAKPARKGKTRSLKSKKKKECSGTSYCE